MSQFAALDAKHPPVRERSLWFDYRMRWKRRRLIARSLRKRRELNRVSVHEDQIAASSCLAFTTLRNEIERLPYFLEHYRALGVGHFLVVDNGSDDGTAEYLSAQPDVSVWHTIHSYKAARFGVDWLTCLQFKFAHGKWALTVDADEILILPNGADLNALAQHLDSTGRTAFGAFMLDMYPKGPVNKGEYHQGDAPFDSLCWFDPDNYRAQRHPVFDNLWIQGGVRDRMFFDTQPERAPTLNKTPFVKWSRRYAYVTSTHQILPRQINQVFAEGCPTGVLLHSKFLPSISAKSAEEVDRQEHFQNSELYGPYYDTLIKGPDLWYKGSARYTGPDQLTQIGLMSRGDWS